MGKKKKQTEQAQPVIPKEDIDKSVISPSDVENVVSGNEKALSEQMERMRELTKEQQNKVIPQKVEETPINTDTQLQNQVIPKDQSVISAEEEKSKKEAILLAQKKAEEEKLRQQQLQITNQAIEDKKLEQQALETARKEEQELLQRQEEERKKREQENMLEQQRELNRKDPGNGTITPNSVLNSNQNFNQNVTSEGDSSPVDNPSSQTVSDQNQKGGPSTIKRVMAAMLFIALMTMVYFLPEITSYLNDLKQKNKNEKITSGVLECNLKKNNQALDIHIKTLFHFTNSRLYKMEYTTIYTGDKIEDKEELDKLNEGCLVLKQEAGELEGVTISCSLNNGIHSNKQILDYEKLNIKEVTSAYTEAGGIYPTEFKKSENIDKIESEMTANNYTCSRK